MNADAEPWLGERFDAALAYASAAHRAQRRKGSPVPYIAHLLAVAALVLEHGGGEDEAIAALLHDVVEDQGGLARLDDVRSRFGDRVGDIVLALSDSTTDDPHAKPPYRERKRAYLDHLRACDDPSVLLVSCSDKLHNARSILADVRTHGLATLDRFTGGAANVAWYYGELAAALRGRAPDSLATELQRTVSELTRNMQNAGVAAVQSAE